MRHFVEHMQGARASFGACKIQASRAEVEPERGIH